MFKRTMLLAMLLSAGALTGCMSDGKPQMTTRQTLQDSALLLAVDSVSESFAYGDLLVIVNNEPYRFGAKQDHEQRLFEVQGKDKPSDHAAIGDVIRIPFAGKAAVELRHRNGDSLQQLNLEVPDNIAPAQVQLRAPERAASAVSRQANFQWETLQDPSGVRYQLEYWPAVQGAGTPPTSIPSLQGGSYAVPSDQQLLPATTYRWHVRAIDGAGNVGPWSQEWEFSTGT